MRDAQLHFGPSDCLKRLHDIQVRLSEVHWQIQSISNCFIARLKVDQGAGQLSLPHAGITKTERNGTKTLSVVRTQHVRDRDADVEGAKSWRLVHLRRRFLRNQHVILSSTVLFQAIAFQETVLLTTFSCATARKSLKLSDFLKTGRRNMAETCAKNFLTTVCHSTV